MPIGNSDNMDKLVGGTDDTPIGNVGDRIKVESQLSTSSTSITSVQPNEFVYVDLNASSGGVARDTAISTTFTDVFSYSGAGFLFGFSISLDDMKKWSLRLVVDSNEIFIDSSGFNLEDFDKDKIYGLNVKDGSFNPGMGVGHDDKKIFYWYAPGNYPMRYGTSVVIKAKVTTGASKKFKAGLVTLTKE